jgi:hypothetical protein
LSAFLLQSFVVALSGTKEEDRTPGRTVHLDSQIKEDDQVNAGKSTDAQRPE